MQTSLPGFAGASHIYHVGATGFYLDYADKLGLSTQQRTSLNDLKQRALVDQSNQQRKIDEAEQALWLLTAADQPDAGSVEAKIREIETQIAATRQSLGDQERALSGVRELERKYTAAVAEQEEKVRRLREARDEGSKLLLELDSAKSVYKQALD
ncbi:hypothetical protein, partial [Pseudomonas canadensis]|uniref:hypothetical protein n=1 Tax=Pseudomonas canadensis TaxID=915099 RepID=UPI0030DCC3DA